MPEGDTIRRAATALEVLVGERLRVAAVHPRARATGVAQRIDGLVLEAVRPRGKHLVLAFEGGRALHSHLGMTGSWRVLPASAEVGGRPWLVLRGERAQAVLRGGARLDLSTRAVDRLGPDILAEPLDLRRIVDGIRAGDPRRDVGDVLLDQAVVAGIGNVWRSEALFAAGVSPWACVGELADGEIERVLGEAARLMRLSVEGAARPGAVYRRSGRGCRRCGGRIASGRQGEQARTAYWCPSCQGSERGDRPAGA